MGTIKSVIILAWLPVLIACGGGGGGGGSSSALSTPPASDTIEITGVASKGLINFASVKCFFSSSGAIPENMIPSIGDSVQVVAVDTEGRYSCAAPKNTKTVATIVIPSSNSIMKDEATGEDIPIPTDFKMRGMTDITGAVLSKVDLHITPLSEAAVALAVRSGGLTAKLINQANSGISNIIGFNNINTKPIQISNTQGLVSATDSEKQMSLVNAAISSMAADDSLSCGSKTSYGQSVNCTVGKFSDQFSIIPANTISQLPAIVSIADVGANNLLNKTSKIVKDSAVTAIKAVEIGIVSTAKTLTENAALTITALLGQVDKDQYRAMMAGDNLLINTAQDPQVYDLALLSAKVYDKTWVNGNLQPFNGLDNIYYTDSSNNIYKTINKYNVLNWKDYPEISKIEANTRNLQWNIFYNDNYVIFAYRGSEKPWTNITDWVNDFVAMQCAKITPQYAVALAQYKSLVDTSIKFKSLSNNKTVYLTGHSLGGGIASYIATQYPSAKAVVFNPAPVNPSPSCSGTLGRYTNDYYGNIKRFVMENEPLASAFDIGSFLGGSERFPNPFYSATHWIQSHSMDLFIFALDATRQATLNITPSPANLTVNEITQNFTSASIPYRPAIPISGSRFNTIEKIVWECKLPNGSACLDSPYIWTRRDANWGSKAVFDTTSTGTLYPRLLTGDDVAGIYQWVVTFSSNNQTSVSKSFTVNYQPAALTSINITGMTSAQFSAGTTAITTSEKSYIPSISVAGQNIDKVIGVEWRWSGATSGSASWAKTDANWSTKVSLIDGKLIVKPTVVEASPTWSGTTIWTGTLRDTSGLSKNITFSVVYKAAVQTTACISPQVLQGNQCIAPVVICAAPLVLQGGVCVPTTQLAATSPTISALSFTSVTGDGVGRILTITGSNFANGNVVNYRWLNPVGSNVASATVTTASQLSVPFNPGTTTDTIFVKVCKASGSTVCSGELSISVTALIVPPSINSLSFTSVAGDGVGRTLTITGSNFANGNVVNYRWLNPVGGNVASVTVATASQLSVPFNPGTTTDTIFVKVCKASGSTVCSGELSISVTAIKPVLSSITPNPVAKLAGAQTITIFGSDFASGATVSLIDIGHGGTYSKTPTFINSGQLTVSANFTAIASQWSVTVINPNGQVSSPLSFNVQ